MSVYFSPAPPLFASAHHSARSSHNSLRFVQPVQFNFGLSAPVAFQQPAVQRTICVSKAPRLLSVQEVQGLSFEVL
jgi:hypothetical protein